MKLNQLYSAILDRKKTLIVSTLGVTLASCAITSFLPKTYIADTAIALDTSKADPITDALMAGQLVPSYLATQTEIIGSRQTAIQVVRSLGLSKNKEITAKFLAETGGVGDIDSWLADFLLKNLDVKSSLDSNVIHISYASLDPSDAANVANQFVAAYKDIIVSMRSDSARQSNKFFENQIKLLQRKLEDAQNNLTNYQKMMGIVTSEDKVDTEEQKLDALSLQLVSARNDEITARSKISANGNVASDVLNNSFIQQLKIQVALQQAKMNSIAANNGKNNPEFKQAAAELHGAESQLNQAIQQYTASLVDLSKSAEQRVSDLEKAVQNQKDNILELKSQHSRLSILQHEVDNAQQVYDAALMKLSTSTMESNSNVTNVAILKSATPPLRPSKPNMIVNSFAGIFIGFMLGLMKVLITELTNRRVRIAGDVEDIQGLKVLADFTKSN